MVSLCDADLLPLSSGASCVIPEHDEPFSECVAQLAGHGVYHRNGEHTAELS